ncbi:hypothetical protein AGMMS49556_01820 [Endomicrobiia bacterium]|nr:hypothetical protein AGMMS49556_01820 [Endomicrobiia bacterium]
MDFAVRAVTRYGISLGYQMIGIKKRTTKRDFSQRKMVTNHVLAVRLTLFICHTCSKLSRREKVVIFKSAAWGVVTYAVCG